MLVLRYLWYLLKSSMKEKPNICEFEVDLLESDFMTHRFGPAYALILCGGWRYNERPDITSSLLAVSLFLVGSNGDTSGKKSIPARR
ncbi:unnamed protein product [Lathyrus oleraceus]